MRKRFLLIPALLLLLAGCTAAPTEPTTVPTETDIAVENTFPTESSLSTATEAPVPAATEDAGSALPYLQRIHRPDQSVYQGPGYDYGLADIIRERGTFTIVEEAVDYEGNLWGKLKSGIGWVDLTEIQSEDYQNALISANYADEYLLLHGAYHHCPSEQEYRIPIVFRAYGRLRDVTLFEMEFNAEGYVPGADFFTLPEMTEEMPLVADLAFPGDMSMYGIRFVDDIGDSHAYSIYISGRNGALVLNAEDRWVP